jgi:hypothetical protein
MVHSFILGLKEKSKQNHAPRSDTLAEVSERQETQISY